MCGDVRSKYKNIIIGVLVFLLTFTTFFGLSKNILLAFREILLRLCPFASVIDAIILLPVCLGILAAVFTTAIIEKSIAPDKTKRDKEYILKLFSDMSRREPSPTRLSAIKSIYGTGRIKKASTTYKILSSFLDKNIRPIKKFLNTKSIDSRILCINAKWGSGKTTSLLIAINETDNADNRYIYEAAFKYSGEVGELINDLLKTLNNVMLELGIDANRWINSLIDNLDPDPRKILTNYLKNRNNLNILSSDLIVNINERYDALCDDKKKPKVYIIIDDLDRMQGKDIINILSLLSILRKLKFVRIIIPADLEVLVEALEKYDVVDPHRFIEKYLPAQMSTPIYSGYDMVGKILLSKLASAQREKKRGEDDFHPGLAAIFMGLLAKKLHDKTSKFDNIRYRWLDSDKFRRKIPEDLDEQTAQLLRIPRIMAVRRQGFDDLYDWDSSYNNIRKLQNVIYALKKDYRGKGLPGTRIYRMFSTEEYIDVVDSWIFAYMEQRWDIFGFTVRDALDILDGLEDYTELPEDAAEQFAYVFNQLFPKEKLEIHKNSNA